MRRLGLSLVLLSATLFAQSGGAQAQVVFDDPNSPAGKEYAIPLDEARDQVSGGNDAGENDGTAGSSGAGISQSGKKAKDASSKRKSSKDRGKKDGAKDRSDSLDTSGSIGGGGGGPDEAGANGALLTSGIALAVLLLGGGIAFMMRRGAFGTDP